MKEGAVDNGAPGARLHYDPDYYAANVLDPDGYSLEFVYKKMAARPMSTLLIYGATGYIGRMAAVRAKVLGLSFEIGRRNHVRLAALAAQLDVPFRVFDADANATGSLSGISVLLNFTGPFAHTAEPLIRACIKAGVDYLECLHITYFALKAKKPRPRSCNCGAG
jgi:threonine dehydrogenase-like Zn-dependent dehydrogenase